MAIDILVQNAVGEIVLNRPDKMNALNNAMMSELSEAFDAAEKAQVRALIIRGEGPGFCAGRDLADADPGNEDAEAILQANFQSGDSAVGGFSRPNFRRGSWRMPGRRARSRARERCGLCR